MPDLGLDPREEDALLGYVADRDVPCPRCAYNLRGLAYPKCPECGERLALHVGVQSLRLGPWIVSCISMVLPSGIGILLLIDTVSRWENAFRYMDLADFLFYATSFLSILLAAVVVGFRKRFLRFQYVTQVILAIGCTVLMASYFLWFVFVVI